MHASASLLSSNLYHPPCCLLLISHNSQSNHHGADKVLSFALTSTPSALNLCICKNFFSICVNKFIAGGFFHSAIAWEQLHSLQRIAPWSHILCIVSQAVHANINTVVFLFPWWGNFFMFMALLCRWSRYNMWRINFQLWWYTVCRLVA